MTPRISISPPLLNTSSPWATELSDLATLYALPTTGAVTTRTSLLTAGFAENPLHHQHAFLPDGSSINTYGYSPHPLAYYITSIQSIIASHAGPPRKPFIVSVTGTSAEVVQAIRRVARLKKLGAEVRVEINMSCP